MASSELVEQYRGLVEQYDILRQRIAKAVEQRGRFKENVITRVLEDYERQRLALEDQLAPCEDQVFELVALREKDQGDVQARKVSLDEHRDEIELRHLIGEFAEGEYEALFEQYEKDTAAVDEQLQALAAELDTYQGLLNRAGALERREARLAAGIQVRGSAPAVPVEPPVAPVAPVAAVSSPAVPAWTSGPVAPMAPVAEPVFAPVAAARVEPVAPPEPAPVDAWGSTAVIPDNPNQPPPSGRAPSSYFGGGASGNVIHDARVSFPGTSTTPPGAPAPGAFSMMEDFGLEGQGALDAELPPLPAPSVDDLGGLSDMDKPWPPFQDDFAPGGGFLDPAGPSPMMDGDLGGLAFGNAPDDLAPLAGMGAAAAPRKAYLIKHFGRPDEEPYEMVEVVTSIGRGRDNQIQIKDDTKVSRYHCRVLRENDGYYVEDNNSSNGTLVNGAAVSRQKVEGNEDVTIGETVFRFVYA